MKIFCENWNGVLDSIIDDLESRSELTNNYHEADAFLLWQDVRGDMLRLARIIKYELKKPLFVMQHGRGAVRDYGEPNKFELLADKILVWGESERKRLLAYGIDNDRIAIVGCPLFERLKPKNAERQGKNVLFVPVISTKEEPENILVYAALKIWESEKMIGTVYKHFEAMKKAWAWEETTFKDIKLPNGQIERRRWKSEIRQQLPRWVTYGAGLVNVKLSGVHDCFQYQAPVIATNQNDPGLVDGIIELLPNIDAMVCLEEGTMQLLAAALDIPVIVADIFRYENYGGCSDYDKIEKIKTQACYWTKDIRKLGQILNHALENPKELSVQRKQICKFEGGSDLTEGVNANILREIKTFTFRNQEAVAAVGAA